MNKPINKTFVTLKNTGAMTFELEAATIVIITCFLDFTHWQQQQQQLMAHETVYEKIFHPTHS